MLHLEITTTFWIWFHILLAMCVALDVGVFHRQERPLRSHHAWLRSGFWILLALLFNLYIYLAVGIEVALQFFTAYLIEKSLSIDNLLLFLVLFIHLQISPQNQKKILLWGVLGAIVLRLTLILLGIHLLSHLPWMFYVLGAFLVLSGIKFFIQREKRDGMQNGVYLWLQRWLPLVKNDSGTFFVRYKKQWKVTYLFAVLVAIELTDLLFAIDSIPAVFAITMDPFIVYTSNVFAILGLRAMYFALAPSLKKMYYLKYGLGAILVVMGMKMLLADLVSISSLLSLGMIVSILLVTWWISPKRVRCD